MASDDPKAVEAERELEDSERGVGAEDETDLPELDPSKDFNAVVVSTDWTTETLLGQIERGNVELDPEFQRRDAWTRFRKSRYIESLITGIPVPQIVLAEQKDRRGSFLVLDGKQRLLTLRQFAGNVEEPLPLAGLELREDLNGCTYEDLPLEDRVALDNQAVRTVVVKNWQTDDFLFLVFLRLNTGSVPLSPQELRQALHPGPFVAFANKFSAESEQFRMMFRRNTPDFRMRDVEVLVRFYAFQRFLPEYTGALKPLLDLTCERLNASWHVEQEGITADADACERAISATFEAFGDNAFRRWNEDHYERPFNRAIFDVMTYYAADEGVARRMAEEGGAVEDAFKSVCEDFRFTESISTTTKSTEAILYRLTGWGKALRAAIDVDLPVPQLVDGRIAYA